MYDDPIMRKFAKLELSKPGDCGYDLYNASREFIFIPPGHTVEVPTGIRVKIPDGHAGFIKGRSSTFYRRKLLVIEGIIDSGYTGQLFVNVWNPAFDEDNKPTIIEPMERLGQIVIVTIPTLDVVVVDKLPVTERGDSGFGSTGL
jgi:dUTP pyrophosphatase